MTRYPCDTAPAEAALGYAVRVCPGCGGAFTLQAFRQRRTPGYCCPECSASHRQAMRAGKEGGRG